MLLLKRQQEIERKAAEEAARRAKEKKLQDLAVHPLVKDGLNRDVRDAYLYGLVFAAIADDYKIDKNEKEALTDIAVSLCIPVADVNDAIGWVTSLPDDKKFALIDECIETIKGCEIGVKLFYSQFMLLLALHEHEAGELDECFRSLRFVDKTGVAFPMAKRHAVLKVLEGEEGFDGAMDALADWMGDDALKYFVVKKYGDVTDRLTSERNRKKRKLERKKKELLKKAERIKFATVIEQMSEAHKYEGSLRIGWDNELKECLSDLRADDIDWSEECKLRLAALDRIPHCYAKLLCSSQERPRRKIVWKLMCMLYVFGGTVRQNEIDDLLRSATQLSTEGYRKRIENFIVQHFNVRVKVHQPESDEVIKPRFCK